MFHRYQYEAEFYPALSRLPLDLRRKLDVTGIKLSLKDWVAIGLEERRVLCHLPCESAEEQHLFKAYLDMLCFKYHGRPAEATDAIDINLWNPSAVPRAVVEKSASTHRTIKTEEWRRWQSHERYALYKTAVSKNQPQAFEQVLNQLRAAQD